MADKKTNRDYYLRNRNYILYRKKLIRNGVKVPKRVETSYPDGRRITWFAGIIVQEIIPQSVSKCRKRSKNR